MARRSPVTLGLALALVFVITTTTADDKCRTGCQGAAQTFKYQDGTTYKYNFDSKIEITLSSAEGQKSTTEVKAQVLLSQQPQCNQILRLSNVQIISSDGKKHTQIPDIEKPIRLNYHDGHLEDSICIVPGDTQNSLNIKRAIASIFQANLKPGHETDVFGLCPTEVTHQKEGNFLVVQKARNLNRCSYRESIKQDFLTTAFNLNSEIKSSPLLNADYRATLKIKNGILDQATVTEDYLYIPFSSGNSGAKAKVETTLKYVGTAKDNAIAKVSQPRSIIFEDPHPVIAPASNVNSILTAVRETAKTIGITVSENTAKEFINLVKILRVSKKDDLLAVYSQVKAGVGFADKVAAKKIFLDALLRAGNGDTIEVALTLLKNKELDALEQKFVYLSLSLVRHTTEASLIAASDLINQQNLPREAYLGIGSLAGKHCKQHQCKNVEAVTRLTQTLLQKVGNGKADNRQKENDIVFALKALANIQHLDDAVSNKIVSIAQDKSAPNRLRVTALETYLADPCKDKLRDSALSILKDIQQDSEIRIKAYLALVQCPNAKIGSAIKALLDGEPSYQVGGFIVTHIRNVRSSANPDKELAKQHLGSISLPKKFPFDPRKYSANGEFSYSIDSLGIANTIEINSIYSQQSFLPRSTSLNLTADVFGHSLNFLELEMRQENLDRLVEHYLGPKSVLRTEGIKSLFDDKGRKNYLHQLAEKVEQSLKKRRDVSKNEIDQITKQVHVKTNQLNKDLDLDLSVKAFGSEFLFINVNDDHRKYSPEAIIDEIVNNLNKGIDKLKRFDETFRTNLMFLDAEFAYPTSSGFPLRLGIEGASNVQIKASGAIDVRALLKEDTTVKISLIPSATIDLAGRLTIDTLLVESGLKVISSLHTSTGGDLILDLFSRGLDIKFALPVEKQTLVSATHDVVFHTRELGAPEKNQPLKFAQNKDFSICLDQLSSMIGLTFCAEAAGPNLVGKSVPVLPFPLSGDAKIAVFIEKEDVSQYHYRQFFHDRASKLGLEIDLESLSKSGQKKVSIDFDAFLEPEKFIKTTLKSPITSAIVEGRIINTEQEKSLLARFQYDQNEFYGKIGVGIEGSPARAAYKPILEYKTPQTKGVQSPPYKIEGQIIVEKTNAQTKYIFDNVRIVQPNQKAYSVNGNLGYDPEICFADLTLSDGANSGSLKGRIQVAPKLAKYNVEVKNSFNPDANIHVKGEVSRENPDLKHFFQITHGRDLSSKTNVLKIENLLKYKNKSPQEFLVETKNHLTYPLLNTDLQFDFKLDPKEVEYNLGLQYKEIKIGSELDFEHTKKPDGVDYSLDFEVYGLNNKLEVKSKRKVAGDQSQIENSIDANGKKFEINGKVRHHVKPHDIDVGSDLVVKSPTHAPVKVVNGLKYNANEIDVHQKISSGSTIYTDGFLKANKNGNANGNIKINLKGKLIVNGQFKANKGSGNGDITIELPAVNKITKADTTFTIHSPQYNVAVNIYPIHNEDPNKKIAISTNSKITASSIDSKNLIDIINHKLEVNVKGNKEGEFRNGKINGEVDITLPNDHFIQAKLNREFRSNNNILNGNGFASLEHRSNKNAPGAKLSLTGAIRDTNIEEKMLDVEYKFSAESGNGKNLNVDLAAKRTPQGDLILSELTNKIYGSLLSSPIDTKIKATCQHRVHSIDLITSCANHGTLKLTGKYDFTGEGRPLTGDINVDLTSTSKTLRSLKIGGSGSLLKTAGIEIKGNGNVYADSPEGVIVDVNTNGEIHAGDKDGRVKGSVKIGQNDPVSISTGFKVTGEKDKERVNGDLSLHYGKNQNIKGDITLLRLPGHEYNLDVKLNTPTEKFKQNTLKVHTKRSEDNTHHQSEIILTSDGKTYTLNSDLVLFQMAPSVDLKATNPDGKIAQITAKITKLTNDQFGAQIKLLNQEKNFLFEGDVDANFESIDNFYIKSHLNAPSSKLDKIEFEAQNKPAKGGKRIQVTAKSAGKNILSGSTSYSTREDHGKLIIEGSGSFKVKDESKSANFKYIRQNLSQDKNGETGIEISFDGALGKKAIDAEFKATNKQFRIANSYCEEKEQCAHIEVDAKVLADELSHSHKELEISSDLRKLGASHEFGLKAVYNRKEYQIDHTMDVHFQSQANSKYQYSVYLHPNEAGVSLTTPKRIIALEAKANAPRTILRDGGKITGEVVLYLDKKNQPNQKSGVIGFLNINPNGQALDGELKFTNPALQRPLLISVNSQLINKNAVTTEVVIDVFAQPAQKIVIKVHRSLPDIKNRQQHEAKSSFEIRSQGLNIDIKGEENVIIRRDQYTYIHRSNLKYHVGGSQYNSLGNIEISPTNINLLLTVLNAEILKASAKMQLSKNQQIIDSEISTFTLKPTVSHLEIKNYNTVKFSAERRDLNSKLLVNSGFIPGQIADFRAELLKGGAKNELLHATLKLDEANFLKFDYGVQSKNIQELLFKPLKSEINNQLEQAKVLYSEINKNVINEAKQLGELTKRATPNLAPLRDYYKGEATKLKDEILADKTIKDISEFFHNVLAAFGQVFGETFHHFSELIESLAKTFQTSFAKVFEVIEKELLPKAKDVVEKFIHLASEFIEKTTEILLTYLAKISQIVEKYQPEFKQIGAAFGEITQDIVRVVVKAYESLRTVVGEQIQQIYNEIKAVPAFESLKAEYDNIVQNGIYSSENVINTVKEIFSTLRDLAPNDELKALVDSISQYIISKLSNQDVDDIAALDKISKAALTVFRSFAGILASGDTTDFHGIKLPLPVNIFKKLPRLAAGRFSPLAYLLKEDIPDTSSLFTSLVNHPRHWFAPFPLYALVAQGQHIFTFDGKHVTFPGKCNYLFAHDAVDGNFTIAGTYENGILTSITLAEGRDTVTLKTGGQVLMNNAPVDLPARKPNIAAFRTYERIDLITYAGAHVMCGPELVVCSVSISGFYHGKLRGLLGNGNNDPYDDFTQANGKIVSSESDFGNSFKMSGSCPAVQTVSHHGHHATPSCDKLFGYESSMRPCYWFVNTDNFKMACEHGVAAGVKDTEHAIAIAYVAACNRHFIPIRVPDEFLKCKNGDATIDFGIDFSVKTPEKSADIVILLDTIKKNEVVYKEYITPLIPQLTNELTKKGISDVQFHLITYGGENQWPSHITVDGKLTFKGKAPEVKFADSPKKPAIVTGSRTTDRFLEIVESVVHDLKLALGLDLQAKTYNAGFRYPFRANAIKSIIAVTGSPCEVGVFYPVQLLRTVLYRDKNIKLNLITPFSKLVLKDAKHSKDVIGFNSETVFVQSQTKGKGKGGAELHKDIEYSDYCVSFTAQNDGNVFVVDNFLAAKGGARKQFAQATSHAIAEQFLAQEQVLECECKAVSPFTAQNICKVLSSVPRKGGVKS